MPDFGYAGEILKIDLSDGKTTKLRTADYADKYLGGRGIAARLYLDMVPPHVKAFAPENHLIFMTGPVAGFPRFAGCRTQICGKSPQMNPEFFPMPILEEAGAPGLNMPAMTALWFPAGLALRSISISMTAGKLKSGTLLIYGAKIL
jgi:hypothetical protein